MPLAPTSHSLVTQDVAVLVRVKSQLEDAVHNAPLDRQLSILELFFAGVLPDDILGHCPVQGLQEVLHLGCFIICCSQLLELFGQRKAKKLKVRKGCLPPLPGDTQCLLGTAIPRAPPRKSRCATNPLYEVPQPPVEESVQGTARRKVTLDPNAVPRMARLMGLQFLCKAFLSLSVASAQLVADSK